MLPIELSIQQRIIVEILGPIPRSALVQGPTYREVQIREIRGLLGPVRLTAYVRVKIEMQQVNNYIYGSGAVTDGVHHLVVNVTRFSDHLSPEPGTHVTIVGELHRNNYNTSILQVSDMASITLLDDAIMPAEQLANGFSLPPRNPVVDPVPPNQLQVAGGQVAGGHRDNYIVIYPVVPQIQAVHPNVSSDRGNHMVIHPVVPQIQEVNQRIVPADQARVNISPRISHVAVGHGVQPIINMPLQQASSRVQAQASPLQYHAAPSSRGQIERSSVPVVQHVSFEPHAIQSHGTVSPSVQVQQPIATGDQETHVFTSSV